MQRQSPRSQPPRLQLQELTGPHPLCPGPAWILRWPAALPASGVAQVIQELIIEFPVLMPGHTTTAWGEGLGASQTASQLVMNLARLLLPDMIEQRPLQHALGSTSQPALVAASLQHELCGESLQLAGLILGCLPCFGATSGEGRKLTPRLLSLRGAIQVCCSHHYTTALLETARAQRIHYQLVSAEDRLYQVGSGRHSLLINSSQCNRDSFIGSAIAQHKGKTNRFLRQLGLPVPLQVELRDSQQWPLARDAVGYPCVAKPVNLDKGQGVSANISSDRELQAAVQQAFKTCPAGAVVEQQIPGDDYRIVMVGCRLMYAVKREAPVVIGDGVSRISELIEAANAMRRQLRDNDGVTAMIRIDAEVRQHLHQAKVELEDVLAEGQTVRLRANANVSTGGLFREFTEGIHPEIRDLCQSIAASLDIDTLGIDYITTDISKSPAECPGAVIEVNPMPQITPHWAQRWLEEHLPASSTHRPPTTAVISSALDSLDARTSEVLEHIADLLGRNPATTSSSTVLAIPSRIGDKLIAALPRALRQRCNELPRIRIYSHPNEIHLDRSHEESIFLMGSIDILRSGLPCQQANILLALDSKIRTKPEWRQFIADLSTQNNLEEVTAP